MFNRVQTLMFRTRRHHIATVHLLLCLGSAAAAHAAPLEKTECSVEDIRKEIAQKAPGLMAAIKGVVNSSRCSSLVNLLRRASNVQGKTGRQLQEPASFERREAEMELRTARANAEFAAALAAELAGETDEARKMLLEAVVLHDKGYLKARDLLLIQLQEAPAK